MQYNINAFILSNKQIQKKAKLFRQSVQLIERQVLSTDLRGYKGEFLIWSWGLKNKVFLSMNFMTNFGLSKLHIGLNISMKLNRTLIDASVIF